jgi:DNA-binding NarL/FixJ family response regulator
MKPTVLLADDHSLVVEGICRILEDEFDIVGRLCDGTQLVAEAARLQPDIVLADISLPGLSGIEAIRKLQLAGVNSKLVVLSQHSERMYVQAAFAAGAHGYISKQSAASELVTGLREVLAGRYFISAAIPEVSRARTDPYTNPTEAFHCSLTARQREVLQLIAEGRQAKQIAALLNISPKTVEFHKAGLMDCLGLRTTAELTRYAVAHGIVPAAEFALTPGRAQAQPPVPARARARPSSDAHPGAGR